MKSEFPCGKYIKSCVCVRMHVCIYVCLYVLCMYTRLSNIFISLLFLFSIFKYPSAFTYFSTDRIVSFSCHTDKSVSEGSRIR